MIISDLNLLETVEVAEVVGGQVIVRDLLSSYAQVDQIGISFASGNTFATTVNSPFTLTNSAAAGAKGDAINNTVFPTYSYTKADTVAVAQYLGGSFSGSTSVAVINTIF